MFYAVFANWVITSNGNVSDYTKSLLVSLGKDPDVYLAKFMGE